MYEDHYGEFICGYWGLKGQVRVMARYVQLLRHDAYCTISAEIRTVDSQSDLRFLLEL